MKSFDDLLVTKDKLTLADVDKIVNYKFDDFDDKVYGFLNVDYFYDLQMSGELFSKESINGFADEDDESLRDIDLDDDYNWYLFDGSKFYCAYEDDINNVLNNVIDSLYGIAVDR